MWAVWTPILLHAQVPLNPLPIRIGADQTGSSVFRGEMAAVRLYDRGLAENEVKTLAAL